MRSFNDSASEFLWRFAVLLFEQFSIIFRIPLAVINKYRLWFMHSRDVQTAITANNNDVRISAGELLCAEYFYYTSPRVERIDFRASIYVILIRLEYE